MDTLAHRSLFLASSLPTWQLLQSAMKTHTHTRTCRRARTLPYRSAPGRACLIMGSRCSLTDPVQGETGVHARVKVTLGKCRHTPKMRAFLI